MTDINIVVDEQKISKFKKESLTFSLLKINTDEARNIINQTYLKNPNRITKFRLMEKNTNRFIKIFRQGTYQLFNYTSINKHGFIHDPIIIDTDGCVYEGRHRIMALSKIEENLEVEIFFILGFNPEHKKLWSEFHDNVMRAKGRR